jgi:hypothetical protein
MNLILTLISILSFLLFINSKKIQLKREENISELVSIYSRMELFFIINNINLSKDYIELLKIFKNLSINSGFLDLQVLLAIKISAEKKGILNDDKKWFDDTLESLGKDFKVLFNEFDIHSNEIIRLSLFKPEFVVFVVKKYISSIFNVGFISIKRFIIEQFSYTYIRRNEQTLSHIAMRFML